MTFVVPTPLWNHQKISTPVGRFKRDRYNCSAPVEVTEHQAKYLVKQHLAKLFEGDQALPAATDTQASAPQETSPKDSDWHDQVLAFLNDAEDASVITDEIRGVGVSTAKKLIAARGHWQGTLTWAAVLEQVNDRHVQALQAWAESKIES